MDSAVYLGMGFGNSRNYSVFVKILTVSKLLTN